MLDPPVTADASSLVKWCVNGTRPQQFYIDRLGLPQLSEYRNKKGIPKFKAFAAKSCKALFKSTCKAVAMLEDRFEVKGELRNATTEEHLKLAAEVVEPILSAHGSKIWGASEPRMTRIIPPDYPRYLRYSDTDDRERYALNGNSTILTSLRNLS